MRSLALLVAVLMALAAAPGQAQGVAECTFGFEIDTQSSAFHALVVDGEEKDGFWLSISRAPADVREIAAFIGRLQVCLMTEDGRPATVTRGGRTVELDSPFVVNCTAALLPGNRLLTNWHCLYEPSLTEGGFTIVREVRVNFGYTSRDDTGRVRTYLAAPREIAVARDLDALVLPILGADANADLGGHIPMRMLTGVEPFQELRMIHHPGASPQQYSTGTCQVHRRQAEIAGDSSPFRHSCESMGGSSGALIFDARTLAVVALHNQGGLRPTGDSFNGGHKIAMVNAALNLGFEPVDPGAGIAPTAEFEAARALADALLLPDRPGRIEALGTVMARFAGSETAAKAEAARARLLALEEEESRRRAEAEAERIAEAERLAKAEAERVAEAERAREETARTERDCEGLFATARDTDICPDWQNFLSACPAHPMHDLMVNYADRLCAPEPEPTLADRMAADADVQACDRLAGSPDHPDRAAGLMLEAGVSGGEVDADAAIPVCLRALEAFPDQPRILANLGRAHGAIADNETAADFYRRGAALGDVVATNNLAAFHRLGLGVEQDDALAAELFQAAAEQGLSLAQLNIGHHYREGRGVPQSDTEAVRWYLAGAEQGEPYSQLYLGYMYEEGRGVPKSEATALEWYRRSAESDSADALFRVGRAYAEGRGVRKDAELAARFYRQASDAGHLRATYLLGRLYLSGEGVDHSPSEGARLVRAAADAGDLDAQHQLGVLYERGIGVARNLAWAHEWNEKAAENGNRVAMVWLGDAYLDGNGVEVSEARALDYFQTAAEAGYADGQVKLGLMYYRGTGTGQDFTRALQLFKTAADQDHPRAAYNYALMVDRGEGARQDTAVAYQYYRRAADLGDDLALYQVGTFFEFGEVVDRDPETAAEFFAKSLEAGDNALLDRPGGDFHPDTARALQRLLKERGQYTGAIDGQIGPGTRAAMRRLMEAG